MKKILISVLVILVLGIFYFAFQTNTTSEQPIVTPQNSEISSVDLSIKMESDLGLKDVLITPVAGDILEIRIAKPENVSKENLAIGTAYIFGYLEPNINKVTKKVRIIYTNNFLDETLFEISVPDISLWVNKKIDDSEFAKKIKFADLSK